MFICYFLSRPEKKKEGIKSLLQHTVDVVALLFAGRFAQQPAVSVHQRRDSCMAITSPEAGSRCEAQGNKKWIIFVCWKCRSLPCCALCLASCVQRVSGCLLGVLEMPWEWLHDLQWNAQTWQLPCWGAGKSPWKIKAEDGACLYWKCLSGVFQCFQKITSILFQSYPQTPSKLTSVFVASSAQVPNESLLRQMEARRVGVGLLQSPGCCLPAGAAVPGRQACWGTPFTCYVPCSRAEPSSFAPERSEAREEHYSMHSRALQITDKTDWKWE